MDYKNKIAKLYKLYSINDDDYYIGCCFEAIDTRVQHHYKAYYEYLNNKRKFHESFKLFEKYGDNIFIELIKEYPNIKDKDLLRIKRDEYIKQLNKQKQQLTKAEYSLEWKKHNKQRLHDYYQQYYKDNIDKIRERYRQTDVCYICDIELNRWSMNRHILSKKHLDNVAGIIRESKYKRIQCECKCYTIDVPFYINKHKQTLKHKRNLERINKTMEN